MSLRNNLMAALAAVSTLAMPIAPLAAADGDTVEAASPKDEGAENTITLDKQSWRDLQCLSILFFTLTDPEKADDGKLQGALMLNIGYHLGMVNQRSPDISPPNLILLAIEKTFTPEGVPEEVKNYCKAVNGVVADEFDATEAVLAQAAAKAAEQAPATDEAR